MNRSFRITSTNDFKRVRRDGKSYAHPLAVVLVSQGQADHARVGIITSKAIGNAVQRNRARRRLRAILNELLGRTTSVVDLVVIGRTAINAASFLELKSALYMLFVRAGIVDKDGDS